MPPYKYFDQNVKRMTGPEKDLGGSGLSEGRLALKTLLLVPRNERHSVQGFYVYLLPRGRRASGMVGIPTVLVYYVGYMYYSTVTVQYSTATDTKIAAATRARPPYATTHTPLRLGYGYESFPGLPGHPSHTDDPPLRYHSCNSRNSSVVQVHSKC